MRRWCEFAAPLVRDPCVVFDVDGTLLNADGSPVRETVDFYHWCVARGLRTVVITSRARADEPETVRQLHRIGVRCTVHTCDTDIRTKGDQARFKRAVREKYTVIANLGDRWSDFGEERELHGVERRNGILLLPHVTWVGLKV